jgi:hypothetical protein
MARATSRRCSARRARVTFWVLPPTMYSTLGARSNLFGAPRRRLRKPFPRTPGGACRPAKEPKDRACTTGLVSNWPIHAGEYNSALKGKWTRGLMIRRSIADSELAFFSTWCSKGASMEKLVSVEGHRWAIEDSFEAAKNELGLDHNETRSWHGWHRHVSLAMFAFAMMAVIRHHANAVPLKKRCRVFGPSVPDPLVDPGNPPHLREACSTAHPTHPHHRVVTVAPRPPGRRAPRSPQAREPQKKHATVMLVFLSQESESEGRGLYGRRLSYLAGPDLDRCQPPEADLGRRCQSPPLLFRSYSVTAGFATAGIRDFRSSNSSGADSSVTHIIKVKSLR